MQLRVSVFDPFLWQADRGPAQSRLLEVARQPPAAACPRRAMGRVQRHLHGDIADGAGFLLEAPARSERPPRAQGIAPIRSCATSPALRASCSVYVLERCKSNAGGSMLVD
jgi:hypothetical protein